MSDVFFSFNKAIANVKAAAFELQRNADSFLIKDVIWRQGKPVLQWQAGPPTQNDIQWQDDKPTRIKFLEGAIKGEIKSNMTNWSVYTLKAIDQVDDPPEERSIIYWAIALTGNLVWAATSIALIAELPVLAITFSFAGATIGSGTIEKGADAVKPILNTKQARTTYLDGKIAYLHGLYEEQFKGLVSQWAAEFDNFQILEGSEYARRFEEFIWKKMFPVNYCVGRYEIILRNTKYNIEKILEQFKREYEKYDESLKPFNSQGIIPLPLDNPSFWIKHFEPDLRFVTNQMVSLIRNSNRAW